MAPSGDNHSGAAPHAAAQPGLGAHAAARECVIVVHGLWMHGIVMARFCARLRRAGFRTATFSYSSLRVPAQENADALGRFIAGIAADRIHIVAHSLGGLVSLLYLRARPDPRVDRVVLLGSPVSGSAVAARLAGLRIGKLLLGQAQAALTGGAPLPLPQGPSLGVIAGTLGVGMGRLVTSLRSPHDGTVQLDETRLPGAADFIALPVSHTGMVFSNRVSDAVIGFLHAGRFPRES